MNTKTDKKQNISLIIGLSIPVAMVLFIGIAINWPRWFNNIEPARFDFLYTVGQQNPYLTNSVEKGRLHVRDNTPEDESHTYPYPARFFIHDVSDNTNREVDIEEAMTLSLDGSVRSPDGFTISNGRRRGWFVFGWGYNNDRYLVKERFSEKINLESSSENGNYYWNFRLIGWVINSE